MTHESLNQDLTHAIKQAIADPISADLQKLLDGLERSLLGLAEETQLRIAGNIFAQLVEIYASRFEQILGSWEEKYSPVQEEPVLTADMLQDVLRHSMTLNLEEVVEDLPSPSLTFQPTNSMIGEVEKATLLEFLHQFDQEQAKQSVLNIAHSENISRWVEAIAHWLQAHPDPEISLLELQESLRMPLIEVWLALLLGGYRIEQRGEFYQTEAVWICNTR